MLPRLSLRELLAVVLFAALGSASLRAGGILASFTIFLAALLTMGLAIVAFVGREALRAFGTGFVLPIIGYACVVFAVGHSELDPYEGRLPTTRFLRPVFEVVATRTWIDQRTGKVVPGYDPAKDRNIGGGYGGGYVANFFGGYGGSPSLIESPDRTTFMSLGHVLIGVMLGYAGGKFAVAVHQWQSPPRPRHEGAT